MTSTVCRVCLDGNVKMHRIQDCKLLDTYETITSIKINTEDGLPTTICYICVSQLQRCRRFFDMARQSIRTLTHQIHSGQGVTSNNITSENLGETHRLMVTNITHMTEEHYSPGDCQVKVKQEQEAVKEEPVEYEDLIDIEVTSNNITSENLDETHRLMVTNITHLTEEHYSAGDCQVKVKQEQEAAKEEPVEYEDLLEESRLVDVDAGSGQNRELPLLKDCSLLDQNQFFNCDVCNTKCISKSNLIRHMKTHIRKKPYACDICNKAFNQVSHLKEHKLIHTGEKPYACDICKKAFYQASNLKQHMLIHTGERPYVCDVCNKTFNHTGSLKLHMLIHTGERPYACDICKKAFSQSSNLKQHMLIHTGERPYACDICKKAFNRAECLRRHIMLIHTH